MTSHLSLKTLQCIRKHDVTGKDEPQIMLDGQLYWNGVIEKGEDLPVLGPNDEPYEFTDNVTVEFREANGSKSTRIGSVYTLKEKNGPNSPMVFKNAGTHYTLTFTIVPVV